MSFFSKKPEPVQTPEEQSIDGALATASAELAGREESLAQTQDEIEQARKQAKQEAKDLEIQKRENAAAKRFGQLAANPKKALAKVKRDKWTRGIAAGATAALALSLTAQFTDLDERAVQSLTDKYNSVLSLIGSSEQSNIPTPENIQTVSTQTQTTSTTRPKARPKDFNETVTAAKIRSAVDTALSEMVPAGPGDS